jgi:hypothetical protein
MVQRDLFKTQLPNLPKRNKKDKINAVANAYQYFEKNYLKKPILYHIDSHSTIQYIAKEEGKEQQMTIGTFAIKDLKPPIVNFYEVSSNYHGEKINTYRFGTPLHYFNDVRDIIYHFQQFQSNQKKFISISLITPCNTPFCTTIHKTLGPLQHVAKPIKSAYYATLEQNIIDIELKANHKKFGDITYYTILFPMTQQHYKGIVHKLLLTPAIFQFEKNKYKRRA